MIAARCVSKNCLVACLLWCAGVNVCSGQDQGFFDVTYHPLMVGAIYSDSSQLSSEPSAYGAIGVNIDWENGSANEFFIEQQRHGASWIAAGIQSGVQSTVDTGELILDWGFQQQHASDGSFPGTGDAVHSTSLFLEATTRASVLLNHANSHSAPATWGAKIQQTAAYMSDPAVTEPQKDVNLEPFAHRYFLRAAALEMAASLAGGNAGLSAEAQSLVNQGLATQDVQGVLPERGGFDFNYQGIGLTYLGRYYQFASDAQIKADIAQSMTDQLAQFTSRVDSLGNVDVSDSTRIGEPSRSGAPKNLETKNLIEGFLYASAVTAATDAATSQNYLELATLMAQPITPLVEYKFDDPSKADGLISTGSEATSLFARLAVGGKDTTPRGPSGTGVTGHPDDYGYDLSDATSMGTGDGNYGRTDGNATFLDNLQSFTLTGWFKTDGTQAIGDDVELFKTDAFKLTAINDGYLRLFVDSHSSSDSIVSTFGHWNAQNEWVFFAVSYDGTLIANNVSFYVGSDLTSVLLSSTQTLDRQSVDLNSSRLFLSRQDRPFDGWLDNMRVYGSSTDASGILSLQQLNDLRTQDLNAFAAIPEPAAFAWLFCLLPLLHRRRAPLSACRN
ncbi:MAG: LamG-like jellyroll fold domain-containing protein [Planctomycetota bacterium]